jgi:hypothetical protein
VNEADIVKGFDEWLRQYTENPDGFASTTATVLEAMRQRQNGEPLTYGQECLAVLREMAGL